MSLLDPVEEIEKRTEFHFPINGDWLIEIGFKEVIPRSYVFNAYNRKWFMRLHSASHNVWQLEYLTATNGRDHRTSRLVSSREQLLKILLT
jgi:hypothetical protein